MQTNLAEFVKVRAEHDELESILRACVHCGFCNATCPTYQLTGDELDGPRGRIYLMKQMLEGQAVSQITQRHLDRCLNCRSCETTCPSGVEYGRLLDLGRVIIDEKVGRPILDRLRRKAMSLVFPHRQRFNRLMVLARFCSLFLSKKMRVKIPDLQMGRAKLPWPESNHTRKVLLLQGCVQQTLAPSIDLSAARVLDQLGVSLVPVESSNCCGALNYHLSEHDIAKVLAKKNIDACWPLIEQGIEAIIMTASGCGVTLKEYAKLLQYDSEYTKKAQRFSRLVKDISEILRDQDLSHFETAAPRVAFQSPCTLQHGQNLAGVVESILSKTGIILTQCDNSHLCCGSAGVYSLLQPEMSNQLRENKLNDLLSEPVDFIATANIGCLTHLQAKTSVKVIHWIELLDQSMQLSISLKGASINS